MVGFKRVFQIWTRNITEDMCIRTHTCMQTKKRTLTDHVPIHTHTYIFIYIYTQIHIHTYICRQRNEAPTDHIHMHTYTYIFIYTYIHTKIHIYTYITYILTYADKEARHQPTILHSPKE